MLHWFPLEELSERYTQDWARWFPQVFCDQGIRFATHDGDSLTEIIESGEFLDIHSRPYFAMSQIMSYVEWHRTHKDASDILLFADLWHHGIESIPYMKWLGKHNIETYGVFHAGSYDPNDFLRLAGCDSWAWYFEQMIASFVDFMFVGTEWSKILLEKVTPKLGYEKIKVTGLPVDINRIKEFRLPEKKPWIVFPHRLAPEKNPIEAFLIANAVLSNDPEAEFYVTSGKRPQHILSNVRDQTIVKELRELQTEYPGRVRIESFTNKDNYLSFLSKCSVMLSTSKQETFGYGTIESMAAGVTPVVPDRLSYPELLGEDHHYIYDDSDQAYEMVMKYLHKPHDLSDKVEKYQYQTVIKNMLKEMGLD